MIAGGLALLALVVWPSAQDRPATTTVRGVIVDAGTAAPVAGARVELIESQRSTQSGADGRFEFSGVLPGTHTLTVSTIGYIFVRRRIDVRDAPFNVTVPLAEGTGTYQETVDVTAEPASSRDLGVSSQTVVGSAGLQALRGVATDDPVRALQALPGAATGDDFQSQFSVRGSAFRHTGFVIDATATPLLFHSVQGVADTGSVAMLNTDVVSRGALIVGPHTERHGDWVGATLEFDMREGSRDRSTIRAAVSGTAASAVIEGPLGPSRRGSWLVSIRRSYVDWLIRKVAPETDGTFGFTDLHNKIVYDLTSRQQVQLVVIGGDATFHETQTGPTNGLQRARSRGGLGLAGWRFANPSVVVNERLSVAGSEFRDYGQSEQELSRGSSRSIVWRNDATFMLGPAWTIEAGTRAEWQRADQTLRIYTQVGGPLRVRVQQGLADRTHLWSAWSQLAWRTATGGAAIGARATTNSLYGTHDVSPWVLAQRGFGPVTFRASAGAAAQFPEIPLFLSNGRPGSMPAERNSSVDIGVEYRLTDTLRWQVTGFARRDRNILRQVGEDRLANGVRVPGSTFPTFGAELDGSPRGVDIVFERRAATGPAGWIGYTFARTTYRDSMTSETFPGDFDQRHTINAFVEQRVSYRMDVSAKLRVGSNFPIVGYFSGSPESLQLSSQRNRVRLPTYARLDLRANRTFTFDRRRLTLFVEVMNVLGRQNLRRSSGSISPAGVSGFVEREIPFVPSAGLLIEF
jgi:hypothetical protein